MESAQVLHLGHRVCQLVVSLAQVEVRVAVRDAVVPPTICTKRLCNTFIVGVHLEDLLMGSQSEHLY